MCACSPHHVLPWLAPGVHSRTTLPWDCQFIGPFFYFGRDRLQGEMGTLHAQGGVGSGPQVRESQSSEFDDLIDRLGEGRGWLVSLGRCAHWPRIGVASPPLSAGRASLDPPDGGGSPVQKRYLRSDVDDRPNLRATIQVPCLLRFRSVGKESDKSISYLAFPDGSWQIVSKATSSSLMGWQWVGDCQKDPCSHSGIPGWCRRIRLLDQSNAR